MALGVEKKTIRRFYILAGCIAAWIVYTVIFVQIIRFDGPKTSKTNFGNVYTIVIPLFGKCDFNKKNLQFFSTLQSVEFVPITYLLLLLLLLLLLVVVVVLLFERTSADASAK